VANQGFAVDLTGDLDNVGATLNLGSGADFAGLTLGQGGVLAGGTVDDPAGITQFSGGTLQGVTYEGVLDLTPYGSSVFIDDGLTATGAGGTGPGTINLGQYATLAFEGTQSFDDATINLEGSYSTLELYASYAAYVANGYGAPSQTLTLGSGVTIDQTGSGDQIGNGGYASATIVNGGGDRRRQWIADDRSVELRQRRDDRRHWRQPDDLGRDARQRGLGRHRCDGRLDFNQRGRRADQ